MRYTLTAYLDPETGKWNATLNQGTRHVTTVTGLKSHRAVKTWAQATAEQDKALCTPAKQETHTYTSDFHL